MTMQLRVQKLILWGMPTAAAALATLSAWHVARKMSAPDPDTEKFITPWELAIPYEDVEFPTSHNLKLRGWWMPNDQAKGTIVTLAGQHGGRGETLGVGAGLWRGGMNVLLFDYRGRGTSDPFINSLGLHETQDALAAIEYAHNRAPEMPMGLLGYSMGGSVGIMAAARDQRIAALVADSPFASQHEVIQLHIKTWAPYTPVPAVARLFEFFLPYDVRKVEPIHDVADIAPRAVMFIHGTDDPITDPADSELLYNAAREPKELWMLPGVDHCGAYFADRVAYMERVVRFFEQHLNRETKVTIAESLESRV